MMKKTYELLKKYAIDGIFICLIGYCVYACMHAIPGIYGYGLYVSVGVLAAVYGCFCIFLLNKLSGQRETWIRAGLFLFSSCIYLAWNAICRTAPVSDYEVLLNGAKAVLEGRFAELSFDKENYFYFYNYQIGYALYLALIMKVFGTRMIMLKLVNIAVLSASNVLMYMIGEKVYNKKVGIFASVLYTSLLFNIAGSSILNNQHVSMLFTLLSIYYFLNEETWQHRALSGVFMACSIMLRPSAVIYIIGFVCYQIWKLAVTSFQNWKKRLLLTLVFLAVTGGCLKVYDFALMATGLAPGSAISGNVSYYKFLLGLKGETLFGFSSVSASQTNVYFDLKTLGFDYDAYNTACKEHLLEILKGDLGSVLPYVRDKMRYFAGREDNQIFFALTPPISEEFASTVMHYGYVQYVFLVFGLAASSIWTWRKSGDYAKENHADILFKILFIGYFLVHVMIEVQTRYRFDQYMLMCIILAPQMVRFTEHLREKYSTKAQ